MGLYDLTFYDLISRNSTAFRRRQAWLDAEHDRTLTFSEFKEQVDRLACGLQKQGVVKSDRIGVLAKNSLDYFSLIGASAALGAIVLPINWRLSAEEICFIVNDCKPRLLFTDREYLELIKGLKGKLPSVEGYFCFDPEDEAFHDFGSLLDKTANFQPIDVSSNDGFVIIYTAAVAGRPRGALLSHGNVLCADMHLNYFMNVTPKDIHLSYLPFFHVAGLFMATASFHAGALSVNVKRFDAPRAVELIQEKKISFIMDFAPVLASVLEESQRKSADLSSLRAVVGIDTPDTIEKYQSMTGGTFWCVYGQTETSLLATMGCYNDRPGSAGRVLPLAQVRLMNDYDKEVPLGQVGEITMKGPMVFKGYWNLPEDTAYTFREGWHHTGDMGRFDEEGFLWYAGRKAEKELIKPGGENVYPAEVEKVILQHPAVEKVVVFGVPDPKWKEGIKAVCQLKEGHTLGAQALIEFVGERIARYKKPQYVEFIGEMPLQKDGTPDRQKVKALYGGTI